MRKKIKKLAIILLAIIVIPLLIPQSLEMPVQGATNADFNPETFWYHPWGSSIVHKGVDIFAKRGTSVHAATWGIVLFTGSLGKGGKVVLVLGPKWRLHYYNIWNEKDVCVILAHTPSGTVRLPSAAYTKSISPTKPAWPVARRTPSRRATSGQPS